MMEPPAILDSSLVLLYAVLDDSVRYTGRACVIVGGTVIDPVPRLAICLNLYDDDILLLRCDDEWNVVLSRYSVEAFGLLLKQDRARQARLCG